MKAMAADTVVLCFFFLWNVYSRFGCSPLIKMENKIYLVPIGPVEDSVLDVLDTELEKTFNCRVVFLKAPEGNAFYLNCW